MLAEYVARFASLQTNKNQRCWPPDTLHQAPHKPFLLLTIIDLFEQSRVTRNLVEITPELVEGFAEYWYWTLPSNLKGDLAVCFFHLKSEGFWHLIALPGKEEALAQLDQAPSLAQLQTIVWGARLDDELYQLLMMAESRIALRSTLIRTYFSPSVQEFLVARTSPSAEPHWEEDARSAMATIPVPARLPPGWKQEWVEGVPEYERTIEVLGLSVGAYNSLRRAGISTVAALLMLSREELLSINGLGWVRLADIAARLQEYLAANPMRNKPQILDVNEGVESSLEQTARGVSNPGGPSNDSERVDRVQGMAPHRLPPEWPVEMLVGIPRYQVSIDELPLSGRLRRALKRNRISTVAHLLSMSEADLLAVRGFGARSVGRVRDALRVFLESSQPLSGVWSEIDGAARDLSLVQRVENSESSVWSLVSGALVQEAIERGIPLQEIPVERLGLISELEESLRASRRFIGDALAISERDFMSFSPEWRDQLRIHGECYLRTCLSMDDWEDEVNGVGCSPVYQCIFSQTTLGALIVGWLAHISERQKAVVTRRYTLFGGNKQSLQEIGQVLGVTRERVRQLEREALNTLRTRRGLELSLEAYVEGVFWTGPGVVTEMQLVSLISDVVACDDIHVPEAIRLLLDTSDRVCFFGGQRLKAWLRKDFDLEQLLLVLKATRRRLKEVHAPVSFDELERFVECELSEIDGEPKCRLLRAIVGAHEDFRVENDKVMLASWERKITDEIVVALRRIGEPAHYRRITEVANSLLPSNQKTAARNVHSQLGRYAELFVRVGQGIFGLREWGLPEDGNVANAAYRVLTEADQPLHLDILIDRVLETWRVHRNSVVMAVGNDDRFVSIGSGVFWLRDRIAGSGTTSNGVDFADFFCDRLSRWQEEVDQTHSDSDIDSMHEVEKIRNAGLNLFE
ncbi:MAG: hypothetical protein M5U05_18045 [Anaerolineales bacterium]|nr:hypothetical protein [Anaerolineales bacterium]